MHSSMDKRNRVVLVVLGVALVGLFGFLWHVASQNARGKRENVKTVYDHGALESLDGSGGSSAGSLPPKEKPNETEATVVRGRVADPEGLPVQGARVSWIVATERADPWVVRTGPKASAASDVSDAKGEFRVAVFAPRVKVVVHHAEYVPYEARLELSGQVTTHNVVLERGQVLTGTVYAKELGPLAGVHVVAIANGTPLPPTGDMRSVVWSARADAHQATTDDEGRFRFGGLQEKEYIVHAIVPGMLRMPASEGPLVVRVPGAVDIKMAPYAVASFQLVDAISRQPVRSMPKGLSVEPQVEWADSRMLWFGEQWTGASNLRTHSGYDYTWLVRSREWPLDVDATAKVKFRVEGYVEGEGVVPLSAPWGEPAKPAKLLLERKAGTGTTNIEFMNRDGQPLTGPLRFRVGLAASDGRYQASVYVRATEGRALVEDIVLPGQTYVEFPRYGSMKWGGWPLQVPVRGEGRGRLQLKGTLLRLKVRSETGAVEVQQGTLAHIAGRGPIRPKKVAEGVKEGVPVPLVMHLVEQGEGARAWCVGPLDPGPRTFRISVPGFEQVTETRTLEPGYVHEWEVTLTRQ